MPAKPMRTPEGDAKFFLALENGHPVRGACEAAGYARRSVYLWRKEDAAFATAWADAMKIAGDLLDEEADRRGRDGYDEPVFFQGEQIGTRKRYSDGLLAMRMKAVKPEDYRERITVPTVNQQSVTVVMRDFALEALMQRVVKGEKVDVAELPPRLRGLAEKA